MKINFYILSLLFCFFISFNNIKAQTGDAIPQHDSLRIDSKILNESRRINVWIPEEYRNSTKALPVLYMPDGGLKEDFPHIANTLSKLISDKKVPAYILVGIENTQRRRDLTPPTQVKSDMKIASIVGGAENFQKFINDELFSVINKKYPTTSYKAIIGESAAGLFIVETLMKKPDMFDAYIAIDPSIWWNNQSLTKNTPEFLKNIKTSKKLWMASSSDTLKEGNKLDKQIKSANQTLLKYFYNEQPKEQHNTIYRAVKEDAMIWALN